MAASTVFASASDPADAWEPVAHTTSLSFEAQAAWLSVPETTTSAPSDSTPLQVVFRFSDPVFHGFYAGGILAPLLIQIRSASVGTPEASAVPLPLQTSFDLAAAVQAASAADGTDASPSQPRVTIWQDTVLVEPIGTAAAMLSPGRVYEITLPAGAIEDLQGNDLASSLSLRFVTAAISEPVAPSTASVSGRVKHWAQGLLLEGVEVTLTIETEMAPGDPATSPMFRRALPTDDSGRYAIDALPLGDWRLGVGWAATPATEGALTPADAMAVLKIALGRNPNPDPDGPGPLQPASVSPWQLIAADYDGDGRVTRSDAEAVLRVAQGAVAVTGPAWVFVPASADLSAISPQSVVLPESARDLAVDAPLDHALDWVAVLRGDLDGSWAATADGYALSAATLAISDFDDGGRAPDDDLGNDPRIVLGVEGLPPGMTVQRFELNHNEAVDPMTGERVWQRFAPPTPDSNTVALPDLADGFWHFRAITAGEEGTHLNQRLSVTEPLMVRIDTVPPEPGVLAFSGLADTGTLGDGLTRDRSFSLRAVGAEPGATVAIEERRGGLQGTWAKIAGESIMSAPVDTLLEWRARVTDAAGNVAWIEPISVTVQVSAVPAPTLNALVGQDGVLSAAELSAMSADPLTQPLLAGQAEAFSTVRLDWNSFNGAPFTTSPVPPAVSTVADAQGRWSIGVQQALGAAQGGAGATAPVWQLANGRYALSLKASDVLGNASPTATVATFDVAATPSLSVLVSGSTVSFGGTADGTLHVSVNAAGTATFSRGSLAVSGVATSATSVTGLFSKTLVGVTDLVVTIAGTGSTTSSTYTLDAPDLRALTLKGTTGTAADTIVVKIKDLVPGPDTRILDFDSRGLASSGDTLSFVFAESARNTSSWFDNDLLALTPDSFINASFSKLKVVAGMVDASAISIDAGGAFPAGKEWEVSSGLRFSLDQLQTAARIESPTGTGALLIEIDADERQALEAFLADPGDLQLIGVTAGVLIDGVLIDLADPHYARIRAGLDALMAHDVLVSAIDTYDPTSLLVPVLS